MRKISASLVCPVSSPAIKRGVIVVDSNGIIREVRGPLEKEEANIEYYSGILIPGLANAHCHLELSHLKGAIAQKTGMAGFVEAIMELRSADESTINQAIKVLIGSCMMPALTLWATYQTTTQHLRPKQRVRLPTILLLKPSPPTNLQHKKS